MPLKATKPNSSNCTKAYAAGTFSLLQERRPEGLITSTPYQTITIKVSGEQQDSSGPGLRLLVLGLARPPGTQRVRGPGPQGVRQGHTYGRCSAHQRDGSGGAEWPEKWVQQAGQDATWGCALGQQSSPRRDPGTTPHPRHRLLLNFMRSRGPPGTKPGASSHSPASLRFDPGKKVHHRSLF